MCCPICKKTIAEAMSTCSACGMPFGDDVRQKLRLYFILKNELENLTSSSRQLGLQIHSLRGKITEYQKEIQSQIEKIALESQKVTKTPPLVEKATWREEVITKPPSTMEEISLTLERSEKVQETISSHKSHHNGIDSEFRFGQKWLLIIGIVTVIFGVAFFLKYSFERGWVGPAGRVSLAYLWGLVFLMAGHSIRKKQLTWFGLSIYGGGIAILYFASYAAFQIYHLFP